MSDIAVSVKNISKMYPLYARPSDRLKQSLWYALPSFLRGRPRQFYREFWALQNVSFEVRKGEALGIIGRNGSGKSTLLQIIAGTLAPTEGEVEVNGRVAALLELGSGFNPDFTGRENVYMNGAILGFSREEIDDRFDDIAAFADIGQFIDQPVKHYSSGMFVRLAFAVQACVEPDVLIVDEALSVGDVFFQQKCHTRMDTLLAGQTAVIIVSHDMRAVEKYSNQALLLNEGQALFLGQPTIAVQHYYHLERSLQNHQIASAPTRDEHRELNIDETFFGPDAIPDWPGEEAFLNLSQTIVTGEQDIALCTGIALCNEKGEPSIIFEMGDIAYFYYEFELLKDIQVPIGGIEIQHKMNINIHGKNSLQHLIEMPPFIRKGARIRFRQTVELAVAPGEYTFMVGLATISASNYERVSELDYPELVSKIQEIVRVRQAGVILVQMRSRGQRLPFHGYTGLRGDCSVSVLNSFSLKELV